jgi:putative ABC transport system permease protein
MAAIAGRLEQESPDTNKGWTVALLPLLEATVGSLQKAMLILLGAVAVVLMIACANVANLLLARSMEREREMAVRAALGAGRLQIVRQLLTESVLLAVLGGGIGLLIAAWGLEALSAIGLSTLPRADAIRMDSQVLGFTLLVSVLSGALFGLLPALHVSRNDLQNSLRGRAGGSEGARRTRLRGLLVISEVALAVTLVLGAGLLVRSFMNVVRVEPGFDPTNVLAMEMTPLQSKYGEPPQRIALYRETIDRFATLPGVEVAGAVHRLPLTGNSAIPTFIEGRPAPPPDEVPSVNYRAISPGYFDALGIPLIRGRLFTEEEGWETGRVVMINQAMARNYWPDEDPLGARIGPSAQGPWLEVVGVVADVKESALETEAEAAMYLPYRQAPVPTMTLLIRTAADPLSYVAAVRAEVKEIDSGQAVASFMTLDDFLSDVVGQRRFDTWLLGLFASLALILAAVGIYGVLSYSVSRRTRELGIRMAVGAPRAKLLCLVLGQGMILVMAGLGIGLVAGALFSRLLGSFLFGVTGTDPLTLSSASALLIVVSLLACYLPARRATRVDPVVALRLE